MNDAFDKLGRAYRDLIIVIAHECKLDVMCAWVDRYIVRVEKWLIALIA